MITPNSSTAARLISNSCNHYVFLANKAETTNGVSFSLYKVDKVYSGSLNSKSNYIIDSIQLFIQFYRDTQNKTQRL